MAVIPPPPVPQGDPNPTPLTRYALQDLNTPCQTDGFYVELVSRQDSAYQAEVPIKRGTPYAAIKGADSRIITQYADNPLYFLKQTADVESMRVLFGSQFDQFVIWIWATQTLSQDSYNAHITYEGENVSYPKFERVSTIKRHVWETNPTVAYLTPLTAMISVAITAAGTGYTFATGTVTGGGVAVAVCFNGAIIDWIVTVEGSSIAANAALTIVGDGTGATATARIQPASCVLVHQEKRELPESDPLSHDYVQVIDVYETLPGPTITNETMDEEMKVKITHARTLKKISDIASGVAIVGGNLVITELQDANSTIVAYEMVTTIPPPAQNDMASALISYKTMAYQFPSRLDIGLLIIYGIAVGIQQPSARLELATVKTYWVISATAPTLPFDQIIPASIYVGTTRYPDILHDAYVDYPNGGAIPYSWPATTPSTTEYNASWLGQLKLIDGEVEATKYQTLWRVRAIFLRMY